MELIVSFVFSVVGGVMCHYIVKWLDGEEDDD